MLINKPELHLAFHVPSLQAYNSVSLVSLLACLSQLVYSLDVWPSAEWNTHTHTHTRTHTHTNWHTRRWFKSGLSVWRTEAEHSRSGGLHSAMNLNYGKHPHSQCLCRHTSCQWYTCVLKDSKTVSNEGGTPRCVACKLKHGKGENTKGSWEKTRDEQKVDGEKCLGCSALHDRCRLLEREREEGRTREQEEAGETKRQTKKWCGYGPEE